MTRAEQWRIVLRALAVVVPMGALIGLIPGYFLGDGALRSIIAGGLIGIFVSGGIAMFDVAWSVGLIPRGWTEAPFLVVLITRSIVWLAIIVVGIAAPLLLVAEVPALDLTTPAVIVSVAVSFLMAVVINFIEQVNRLLGRGVLLRVITGRYHRPREESRVFLLIDLRDSTQIAEELGNLRYHDFLKRYIADVTAGAMRHRGNVHRYIGDQVILTWKRRDGLKNAACVRTVFAILDGFESARDEYLSSFGFVPSIWAAIHLGPVVTGAVGTAKHEIVHLGDTLNEAARIEGACKEYNRSFLASSTVIDALELPEEIRTETLGAVELRGVRSSVNLVSLSR